MTVDHEQLRDGAINAIERLQGGFATFGQKVPDWMPTYIELMKANRYEEAVTLTSQASELAWAASAAMAATRACILKRGPLAKVEQIK